MRRLRPIILRILAGALIGAAVTVGVAVGCAMWVKNSKAPAVPVPFWSRDGSSAVLAWYRHGEVAGRSISSLMPVMAPSNSLDGWGRHVNSCPFPRAAFPARDQPVTRFVLAAGWPRACLWGGFDRSTRSDDGYPASREIAFASQHVVGAVGVGRPFDYRDERGICGYLPITPIWSGLAINTLFYGTIAWALLFLPGTLRRWRRRRGGRCVKCGYDLKGLAAGAACPECGGTRTTRSRMGQTGLASSSG